MRAVLLVLFFGLFGPFARTAAGGELVRGPYLQTATPGTAIVHWRTQHAHAGVLRYGAAPDSLFHVDKEKQATTEHRLTIHGVEPGSTVFYAIGDSDKTFAGGDAQHFVDLPPIGSEDSRILVLGDVGTGGIGAKRVRDAMLAFMGTKRPDCWLLLGDNAYESGTDAQYQDGIFDMYPSLLRNCALWPALGNHDAESADSGSQSGPFFSIFDLPKDGQAGGSPSHTEAYWSFDQGDVHLICLDSAEFGGDIGKMRDWVKKDLAQTTKPWRIAYWHHPPYSKGSHDSDESIELIKMREVCVPALEQGGIDLVLCGHSHDYERSMLIDGHYGSSGSFDKSKMGIDPGDGRVDGDGAYRKATLPAAPHQGAVYVVCGTSAVPEGPSNHHPVMLKNMLTRGGLVVDVHGMQLDCRFVDTGGLVRDRFTIVKGDVTPVLWHHEPVDANDKWRFHDHGQDLGEVWQNPLFNDGPWKQGEASFGYGTKGIHTKVSFGPKPDKKYITTYFRKHFKLADDLPGTIENLRVSVRSTAGFVLYLNGTEILRHFLPAGPIEWSTLATKQDVDAFQPYDVGAFANLLVAGENVLAAEAHLDSPGADDVLFDAVLSFDAFPATGSSAAQSSEVPRLDAAAHDGWIDFALAAPGAAQAALLLRADGSDDAIVPLDLRNGRAELRIPAIDGLTAQAVVRDALGRESTSRPAPIGP